MAGYKPKKKELVIKFSDEEYEGLEVVARKITMREALKGQKILAQEMTEKNTLAMFEFTSSIIIRWNVEDEADKPVLPTKEAFMEFPIDFAAAILNGVLGETYGIPDPLDSNSPNGETLQGLHVPMEAL